MLKQLFIRTQIALYLTARGYRNILQRIRALPAPHICIDNWQIVTVPRCTLYSK